MPRMMSADEHAALERLAEAHRVYEAAREGLQEAVDRARDEGASWERVGHTLGVKRQTAWERFGPCYRQRA